MRKKFIAGNWKMNLTASEALVLIKNFKEKIDVNDKVNVAILAPFTDIYVLKELLKDSKIKFGAQNFYYEDKGAFTGEISADMLLDLSCTYVIIGHSERRNIFLESDEMINKKVKAALNKKLMPILCVGESLEVRENGKYLSFINNQVQTALSGVLEKNINDVTIAYEPIWAIGTGKTATADEAEEVCSYIRDLIKKMYNEDVSSNISILYGGSMNGKNAAELLSKQNIDGGLIGGASLKDDFINIVTIAKD